MDSMTGLFRVSRLVNLMSTATQPLECDCSVEMSTSGQLSENTQYCNYHSFSLVVQRYLSGAPDGFAFQTRRRDGGVNHYWSSDEFTFSRPHHVDTVRTLEIDDSLVMAIWEKRGCAWLIEAIREFNGANTDSDDIPEYAELVMLKSAFEWTFRIRQEAKAFSDAIEGLTSGVSQVRASGPLAAKWMARWGKSKGLIDAWSREFCALRGVAAHGAERANSKFVWPIKAHLAFASVLLPLAIKKALADDGCYSLKEKDILQIEHLDQYVSYDPFEARSGEPMSKNPWSMIEENIQMIRLSKRLYSGV